MKTYGSTAETRKCRRRIATRCKKITDIAFSSTVNASELKKSMLDEEEAADDLAVREHDAQLLGDGLGVARAR